MFIICFRYYQMAIKMTWKMQTPINSSLFTHTYLYSLIRMSGYLVSLGFL